MAPERRIGLEDSSTFATQLEEALFGRAGYATIPVTA